MNPRGLQCMLNGLQNLFQPYESIGLQDPEFIDHLWEMEVVVILFYSSDGSGHFIEIKSLPRVTFNF